MTSSISLTGFTLPPTLTIRLMAVSLGPNAETQELELRPHWRNRKLGPNPPRQIPWRWLSGVILLYFLIQRPARIIYAVIIAGLALLFYTVTIGPYLSLARVTLDHRCLHLPAAIVGSR